MLLIVLANKFTRQDGSIISALLIFTVPQLAMSVFPYIKIFKNFITDLYLIDMSATKELLIRSFKFEGFAVMASLTLQIDYIIMSQNIAPSGIVTYTLFSKIFMMMFFIPNALLAASWPVCSEMFNKGQCGSIKTMLRKYIIFGSLLIIAGSVFLYFFSGLIVKVLAPETSIVLPVMLLVLLCAYYILRVWSDTFAMFLQSINALKVFWMYIPFQALISFAAQAYFSIKYGIYGILIGLIMSFALTSCWILPYKALKVFKSKENLHEV
jgi:O-antigen/teichoic acid export membrane protein